MPAFLARLGDARVLLVRTGELLLREGTSHMESLEQIGYLYHDVVSPARSSSTPSSVIRKLPVCPFPLAIRDPTSFALAVAGLPGIFKSCVDCWQYVRLARTFEQDFGFCIAKLEAAEMQFSRWGTSMGFLAQPFVSDVLFNKLGAQQWSEDDIAKAKRWMSQLETAFRNVKTASQSYKAQIEDDEGSQAPQLVVLDPQSELDKVDSKFKRMTLSIRKIRVSRHGKNSGVGPGQKAAWAIYRKAEFDGLVESICRIVDNLAKLFPALEAEQKALCHDEVKALDNDTVQSLLKVLGENDKLLNAAVADDVKEFGTIFEDVVVDGEGFARLGNTYEGVTETSRLKFKGMRVGGKGVTQAGHRITSSQLQGEEGRMFQPK